jgi:hypothetical protein
MQDSEIRQLDRSRRVQGFINVHTAAFPAGSRGAVLSAAIAAAITETEQQAAKQDAAALDRQESTAQKQAAIDTLLEQMRAINLTARSINNLTPGIADQFKMPRNSDQAVLNRARAYIIEATPIAADFTSRGLPATFLTDLQAAIDAVIAAEDHQAAALRDQTTATSAVALALKQEREAVRELDAIVRNHFRTDPSTLASWDSATHIERAPTKTTTTPPPPTSPP